MVFELNVNN